MKELDVLLERFVEHALPTLPAEEFEAMEGLLALPDPELLHLLTRPLPADAPPERLRIANLVRRHIA